MNVILREQTRLTIDAFAEEHDLTMVVIEREPDFWNSGRYYAEFKGCEVKDGGFLVGTTGNGSTPSSAIVDYTKRISRKTLVFGAYTPNRVEIDCPILDVSFIVV